MSQKPKTILLRGGLDLVSPGLLKADGTLIGCENYEADEFGYSRVRGYERLDGTQAPSAAKYQVLNFDAGTAEIFVGNAISNLAATATAVVASVTLTSGTWGAGTAAGFLIISYMVGTFLDNDQIRVSAVQKATANGAAGSGATPTLAEDTTYTRAAIALTRSRILQPAGSGPIRGVATYGGKKYCWRNNAANTACVMYVADATLGWQVLDLGDYLSFNGATGQIFVGDTVTGFTSGATAVVLRVVLNSGTWAAAGAGYIAFQTTTGVFVNGEALRVAGVTKALALGVRVSITLPPGGVYRSIEHNFYATDGTNSMYFCNGVGPAHEYRFDAAQPFAAPIFTGIGVALNKPTHIAEFKGSMFLSIRGGALQYSVPGEPLVFNGVLGSGEIGLGQDITGLRSNTVDSLIITGRNQVRYLTGTSSVDYQLHRLADDTGAIEGTLEIINKPLFMDDIGIRSLTAVQDYGNWKTGTLTDMVQPWLAAKKAGGIVPVGALRVRSRDQLRMFFTDGSVLLLYMGRRKPECTILTPGFIANCVFSGEDANGNEILLAGSTTGWVYELDRGTSFDGAPIPAFARTSFMNQDMPRWEKRYIRADIGATSSGAQSEISIASDFSYGAPDLPIVTGSAITAIGGGGYWNGFTWGLAVWDAATETHRSADVRGRGENISILFASETAFEESHQLRSLTINYSPLRMMR